MANGWGELEFGVGLFGLQGDSNVPLTGLSLSSSIGSVTATGVIEIGWGGDTWSENAWGELSGAYVDVTGVSLSANIGTITIEGTALVEPTGNVATFVPGQITQRIDVDVSLQGVEVQTLIGNAEYVSKVSVGSVSAQTNTGDATIDPTYLVGEGWGRDTFGNWAWGVNYSVIAADGNGLSATAITGNEDAFTDVVVEITTSFGLNTAVSPVDTQADGNASINVEEQALQSNLGDVVLEGTALVEPTGLTATVTQGQAVGGTIQEVPVAGVSANTFVGNEDTSGNANVFPTGASITGSVGDIVPVSGYDVSGVSATFALGSVTVIGSATVIPTGIGLTANTGSPNIIAWAEVDTGTQVTWTEVDLAA